MSSNLGFKPIEDSQVAGTTPAQMTPAGSPMARFQKAAAGYMPIVAVPGHIRPDGTFVNGYVRRKGSAPKTKGLAGSQRPSWELGPSAPPISCRNCSRFNWRQPGTCAAFPQGIPHAIAYGRELHVRPSGNDGGIVFRSIHVG